MRKLHRKFQLKQTHDNETPAAEGAPAGAPPEQKTFTQDEVNKIVGNARKEMQAHFTKLKEGHGAENSKLLAELENLQKQYMTKEELAKQESDRKAEEYVKNLEAAKTEAKTWKTRHDNQMIDSEILTSAVASECCNPNQILKIIKSDAEVVELNGKMKVQVKYEENGKALYLAPADVLAKMKADAGYANLFKANVKAGPNLGDNDGKVSFADHDSYVKTREKAGL